MVGPVQRGTRSKNDSEDWVCDNCKATNKASQLLLFDVPKLTCSCGREGPDFQLNMREIEVNGHSIIRYVKLQKGPKCIANAYSAAMETKMCIRELRHKRDPSLLPEFDSEKLWDTLGENYPGQVGNMKPRDKLVHMGLALKHKGVKALNGKKYYKISDISTIKSTDIQAMFNAIGNGEPLVAGVRVGKSLHKLKWCKVYKAPSRQRHLDKNNRVINHCVVFIGGGRSKGRIFFYFLNSWGHFCVRFFSKQPNWYGVGKIRRGDLSRNVVMLAGQEDAGRSFQNETGTSPRICMHNKLLVDGPASAEEELLEDENDLDDEEWQEVEDAEVGGPLNHVPQVSELKVPTDVNSVEMHHESMLGVGPIDNDGLNVKNVALKNLKNGHVASNCMDDPARRLP